jgi:hypothetical protein
MEALVAKREAIIDAAAERFRSPGNHCRAREPSRYRKKNKALQKDGVIAKPPR